MSQRQLFESYIEKGYSHLPVYQEILSDLDTPLSLFMKLADTPYSYLFESVEGGEQWARYSIIGLPSDKRIEVYGHVVCQIEENKISHKFESEDPLAFIDQVIKVYNVPDDYPGLPKFQGGLVGYFSYDIVRLIEPRLKDNKQIDLLGVPDILLMFSEFVVVLDNLSNKAYLIKMVEANLNAFDQAQMEISETLEKIKQQITRNPIKLDVDEKRDFTISHSIKKDAFLEKVKEVKQHVIDGNAFQVVLSQRMTTEFNEDPLDLYRVLRTLNPSPYMYYLNLGDFYIVGASPEILVRYEDGQAQVRPIAGTRKRGKTPEEDLGLEKELLADPKELAEHLMLIDLGRNDIGKISKPGKVNVDQQMIVERYSHVMHIVSNVIGEVCDETTAIDVLKSVFPAGTLSGAPKFKAMDIINELEPVKRNIYGGAIGYISWTGNMDTAITIRTAVIKDHKMHVQAGAGLVYDSVPETEWQETIDKAQSILTAFKQLE